MDRRPAKPDLDAAFAALMDGRTILDLAEGLQLRRMRVMGWVSFAALLCAALPARADDVSWQGFIDARLVAPPDGVSSTVVRDTVESTSSADSVDVYTIRSSGTMSR